MEMVMMIKLQEHKLEELMIKIIIIVIIIIMAVMRGLA